MAHEEPERGQDKAAWGKHAYLLDEENIFFASMPREWKSYIGSTGGIEIFCPDQRTENGDSVEYFLMTVCKTYEDAFSYVSEDFIFADGAVGKRYIERNSRMTGREDEGSFLEGLISADERYVVYLCNYDYGLNKGQYERHKDTLENFYRNAAFQDGQIGIDYALADKVKLHIWMLDDVELDIPEGMLFEKTMGHDAVCLKFYLDDTKENVINLYPYGCQYFEDEVWENKRRTLTDSSYHADALCYFMEMDGRKTGQFSFLGGRLVAEYSVSAENARLLEAAMEIVKSIECNCTY